MVYTYGSISTVSSASNSSNRPDVRGDSRVLCLVARDKLREKIPGKEYYLRTIKERKEEL